MTTKSMRRTLQFLALLALSGCVTPPPMGPSVLVMPPPGKPFEMFQADVVVCRQWANQQIGATASEYQTYGGDEVQRRYDNAYIQCMYAKGNQLPAVRRTSNEETAH